MFNPLKYPAAFANPHWITDSSAWVTHIPFGMALVQMLRPRVLVELGTLKGDSYCGFCEAVADSKLPTKCFAVDTWHGDQHVPMPEGQQWLNELRAHHDPRYGAFSTLLQMDFDAAVSRFEDGSIDLLHIDGYHTYEAVKHDYETWRGKLSERAVVLFHDTDVREKDFGVWKFWQEVSAGKPAFEFKHGHGLGVLGEGAQLPAEFVAFIQEANDANDRVQQCYFCLGHRLELFKVANIMIGGLMRVHDSACKRLPAGSALPSPVTQPIQFAARIASEVEAITRP